MSACLSLCANTASRRRQTAAAACRASPVRIISHALQAIKAEVAPAQTCN